MTELTPLSRRKVPEWKGATPNTPVPPRVRDRVFLAKGGRCHACTRKIPAGDTWTCEHVVAIINGGENRELNLDLTCSWCLPAKNAADQAVKSKTYAVRTKHRGIKAKQGRPMPGSRASKFKRKMDGTVVLR